jgi:hypothetical protein
MNLDVKSCHASTVNDISNKIATVPLWWGGWGLGK